MKRLNKILLPALLAAPLLLVSCQGRTMDNMTPTGDTVEVRVNPDSTTVGGQEEESVSPVSDGDTTPDERAI